MYDLLNKEVVYSPFTMLNINSVADNGKWYCGCSCNIHSGQEREVFMQRILNNLRPRCPTNGRRCNCMYSMCKDDYSNLKASIRTSLRSMYHYFVEGVSKYFARYTVNYGDKKVYGATSAKVYMFLLRKHFDLFRG